MDKKKKTLNLIIEQGMLPQYFHADPIVSVQIMKALYHAGLRAIEYTNRGETAISNFFEMRKVADKELPGLQLGAGSVRNKIEATEYINEGASFLVCPSVVPAVADLAEINNLLWVPGCMSATEITLADDLGAELIKLFPAHLLGPSYLKSMKEIFPELMFMPAGGIESNEGNLDSWFRSGASVVELGSKLISKNLVESKDYSLIESLTRQTMKMVLKLQHR
jgi:2-dehydro-3-deoxyphosphogluconate aldolase/(4S)-4-hydroxy-2-oxoglutarate aldolase